MPYLFPSHKTDTHQQETTAMPFTIDTDIIIPTPVADYIDDQVDDFIRQNDMRGARNKSRSASYSGKA